MGLGDGQAVAHVLVARVRRPAWGLALAAALVLAAGCVYNRPNVDRLAAFGARRVALAPWVRDSVNAAFDCLGLRARFASTVTVWTVRAGAKVPAGIAFPGLHGHFAQAFVSETFREIVLEAGYEGEVALLRHEFLHIALRDPSHPPRFFSGRCGVAPGKD